MKETLENFIFFFGAIAVFVGIGFGFEYIHFVLLD